MPLDSLARIGETIRACWSRDTCDPVDLDKWSEANPSVGQCAVTALVLQDLLGGDLVLAEVTNADGSRQGFHYWNRLPGGFELDLTRDQFARGELIRRGDAVPRPRDLDAGRLAEQYRLLSGRVATLLLSE